MPNWCSNKLTVVNATEEFYDFLKDHGFSFQAISPVEEVVAATSSIEDEAKANEQQLANQVEAWSTKWDLDDEEQKQVAFELIENDVVYFNTAWAPPYGVMESLSELFPTVEFKLDYMELGCWFAGTIFAANGMAIDEPINDDDELKTFATEEFDYEWEDPEEDEDTDDEDDEGFSFSADFNTDARTNSLSSYDPDDEE